MENFQNLWQFKCTWSFPTLSESLVLKSRILTPLIVHLQYIWSTKPARKRQQMLHRNSLKLDWLGQLKESDSHPTTISLHDWSSRYFTSWPRYFTSVFIISVVGNTLVLVTCYRNLKVNRFSLMWYLANLASADLRFTFLTPFNANNFSWRWVSCDKKCKRFGFTIETSCRKLNEEKNLYQKKVITADSAFLLGK